jgi:hypothetical protein
VTVSITPIPLQPPKLKVLPIAMPLYAPAWSVTYANETCGSNLYEVLPSPRSYHCLASAPKLELGSRTTSPAVTTSSGAV